MRLLLLIAAIAIATGGCLRLGFSTEGICPEAFELREGGCVWTGGIKNPGFQTGDNWQVQSRVKLQPEAPGSLDPGIVAFPADALCAFATLTQSVEIPAQDQIGPLALAVRFRVTGTANGRITPLIGWNDSWALGNVNDGDWTTSYFCLGHDAYGGLKKLTIAPETVARQCAMADPDFALEIDRVDLVQHDCPIEDQIRDPEFASAVLWTDTSNAEGMVVVDDGLTLTSTSTCGRAAAWGWLSLNDPSINALEVDFGPGAKTMVTLDDLPIGDIRGGGPAIVCLPKWAYGGAHRLGFVLPLLAANCPGEPLDRAAVVRKVKFVQSALCPGGSQNSVDPTFVAVPGRSYGWSSVGRGDFSSLLDPQAGAYRVTAAGCTGLARALSSGTVPVSGSNSGPAVIIDYDLANTPSFDVTAGVSEIRLPAGLNRKATFCFSPRRGGRPTVLTLQVEPAPNCMTVDGDILKVRSVMLTTDASCPSL